MNHKVLHIMQQSPISIGYVAFVEDSPFEGEHKFIYTTYLGGKKISHPKIQDLGFPFKLSSFFTYRRMLSAADKIIVHGLFDPYFVLFLFLHPSLLKKVSWIIWGADLYHFHMNSKLSKKYAAFEIIRRSVLKRVPYYVSYLEDDVEFSRRLYNKDAKYVECLMYPSNFFDESTALVNATTNILDAEQSTINILMGNSADPANNHEEMIKMLAGVNNFFVYIPLSYGSESYCESVVKLCEHYIPGRYKVLRDFMPFKDYEILLSKIDVAMFNFKYQQGMGNIIRLLGLGKTVFMRNTTSTWSLFESMQVEVFDIQNFDIALRATNENVPKIRSYFSRSTCIEQYNKLFSL